MSHKVNRLIAEKINNKPLLITEDSLKPVLDYLENRSEAALVSDESKRANQPIIAERTAIIPIHGSLSYEKTWLGALCGMTSYQQLLEDVEEVLSHGIKTVVFDVDSGGGEAYSCFQTASAIRKRVDEAGAKLITYIDGMSASAAYALTAISDEVISHPMAESGSIGVLIRLIDQSGAMEQAGLKQIFITSAESKVPFNEAGGFKPDFLADLQERVDELHGEFVGHVAKYRGMTPEAVNGLNAKVFSAKKAQEIGLIDKIMEHDQFYDYLADLEEASTPMPLSFLKRKDSKAKAEDVTQEAALAALTEEDVDMTQLADMQAQLDALLADKAAMESDVAEALALIDEKDAELAAALTKVEALEAEKAEAATNAKKAKLVAVVGEAKADQFFDHISKLDSESYDAVIAELESTNKVLESTDLFKETGVTADVDTTVPKESALARRLRQQAEAEKAKKQ